MPEITVKSIKHLHQLVTTKHNKFDLKIDGMKVPNNFKDISYYGNQFHIKHELAEQEQSLSPRQLINQELSQIGTAISHHNLICLE